MNQKKLHILSLLAALTAATIFGMSFMYEHLPSCAKTLAASVLVFR